MFSKSHKQKDCTLIVGEVGTAVGDVKANEMIVRGKVNGIIEPPG